LPYELCDCERVLLEEIADQHFKRLDIAKTYAMTLKSSEMMRVDFKKVNEAIIERWSMSGLEYIKTQAWSGKCWKGCGSRPVGE